MRPDAQPRGGAGTPIADPNQPACFAPDQRHCGVWIVDTRDGSVAGSLRFEGAVQEIFDIQVLQGVRWPELVEPDADLVDGSFVVPDAALSEVAHAAR